MAKRTPEAIRELEPAVGLSNGSPYVKAVLGYAYAVGGQRQNADVIAQQLAAKADGDSRGALAMVQIALGDTARALSNLESAVEAHAPFFTVQPLGAMLFDPVRASARFKDIQRTLGLP